MEAFVARIESLPGGLIHLQPLVEVPADDAEAMDFALAAVGALEAGKFVTPHRAAEARERLISGPTGEAGRLLAAETPLRENGDPPGVSGGGGDGDGGDGGGSGGSGGGSGGGGDGGGGGGAHCPPGQSPHLIAIKQWVNGTIQYVSKTICF